MECDHCDDDISNNDDVDNGSPIDTGATEQSDDLRR